MIRFIDHAFKKNFSSQNLFWEIMHLEGEIYRSLENRTTLKIQLASKQYFIKKHFGIGWKEILKNLCLWRWPIVSAKNEWKAIAYLQKLKIATPEIVAYGMQGFNPATKNSFIITKDLGEMISLEDLCLEWQFKKPSFAMKINLIKKIAKIARTMHQNGINHRDFYLCHFLLDNNQNLTLIDLHRAQIRRKTPLRWIIKDLAGLYFSSKDIGLSQRDLLRFLRDYLAQPLDNILQNHRNFLKKIQCRGNKLYRFSNRASNHGK